MLVDVKTKTSKQPVDLENSDLFQGLPKEMVAPILKIAVLETHDAGDVIFREDEPSHDLLMLRSGAVRLSFNEPSGWQYGEFLITTIKPGGAFGWSTMSGQDRMMAQALAVENCEVYRIPVEAMNELLTKDLKLSYEIMHRLLQIMGKRLRETRTQLRWLLANT